MSDDDLEAQMRALLADTPTPNVVFTVQDEVVSTSLGLQTPVQTCVCCDRGVPTPYNVSNADVNAGNPPSLCQECHDSGCPSNPCAYLVQNEVTSSLGIRVLDEAVGWFDPKLLWQLLDEVDATGDIDNDDNAVEQLTKQGFITIDQDGMALTKVGQEFYDRGYPADEVHDSAPAEEGITFQDILGMIDPRDSEAALLMYDWLCETGRLTKVATLFGDGGGYLYRYQEPKGASQGKYVPGGTQGGRMVDQALEKAKEAGIKPVKRGLCDRCYNAVIQQEDGQVVLNDDSKSPVCPATGGDHSFAG